MIYKKEINIDLIDKIAQKHKKKNIDNTCTKPGIKIHCVSYIMLVHEYRT